MWDRSVPAGSSLLSAPRWASAAQRAAFRARAEFPKKDLDLQAATSNPALSPQPPTVPAESGSVPTRARASSLTSPSPSPCLTLSVLLPLAPPLRTHTLTSRHVHASFLRQITSQRHDTSTPNKWSIAFSICLQKNGRRSPTPPRRRRHAQRGYHCVPGHTGHAIHGPPSPSPRRAFAAGSFTPSGSLQFFLV